MSDDIAGLGIRVDTAPVVKAILDLDRLAAAGVKTEAAAERTGSAWSAAAKKISGDTGAIVAELRALNAATSAQSALLARMEGSFGKLSGAMASVASSSAALAQGSKGSANALAAEATAAKTATSAVDALADAHVRAYRKASAGNFDTKNLNVTLPGAPPGMAAGGAALQALGVQSAAAASALQAASAATAAAGAAAGAAAPAFTKVGDSAKKAAVSAGQTAQAFRTLPAQFTDIVTSLAGGQSPLLVLIQQGGQIKDSFGGIGPAIRAVTGLITPFRLAVGGAATVAAGLAYALAEGANESAKFATSIALTGNAAGITEGQFNEMANRIADSTKTTIGSTRDTLQALVSSGKFTGDTLTAAATAAQGLAKVTGQSSEEIIKSFVSAAGGVAKFAQTSNDQYHFLTATQIEYIRTLEEQGEAQKALEILFTAFNGRIASAATNLGTLERAWGGVKNAISGAVDALLSFGRAATPESAVKSLEAQIAALDSRQSLNPTATAQRRAALVEQLDLTKKTAAAGQQQAAAAAKGIETDKARTAFSALQDRFESNSAKRTKEIANAKALGAKAGASEAETAKVIAGIEEKYKDKKGAKPRDTTRVDARADLLLQVEDLKSASQAMVDQVNNTEKILEARRSSGAVSEADYYAQKRRLLQESTAAQIDALNKENALLAAQKLNTKDGLDRDRQVLKNKAEINKLEGSTATGLTVLTIQQTGAINGLKVALLSASQAAQDYYDTVNEGYSREIEGLGRGDRNRAYESALQQINEKYQTQRRELQNRRSQAELQAGGTLTIEAQKQYDDQLAIIKAFQDKAISSYQSYYGRITDAQRDWSVGAREAVANYFDETQNVAKQAETAGTNAFNALENDLVEFTTTGKLSFKSLADSILKDLARITVKQNVTGPLASALNGVLGSLFKYAGSSSNPSAANYENQMDRGRFAKGGVLSSPSLSAYSNTIVTKPTFFAKGGSVMGEAGPEAIMPLRRGPDGKLGVAGGGGANRTIINNYGAEVSQSQAPNAEGGIDTTILVRQLESAIGQNIQNGSGAIHGAMSKRYGLRTSTR